VGGYFKSNLFISKINSKDLNNPPTSVGGIRNPLLVSIRKDLNNPPTAVGGIHNQSCCTIAHCRGRDLELVVQSLFILNTAAKSVAPLLLGRMFGKAAHPAATARWF
jgi:hypothetical protein